MPSSSRSAAWPGFRTMPITASPRPVRRRARRRATLPWAPASTMRTVGGTLPGTPEQWPDRRLGGLWFRPRGWRGLEAAPCAGGRAGAGEVGGGVAVRSTAAGCPARPPGGSGRRSAGRSPGAATSGRRRRRAASRSAAVRQTPSRYWSRPPSSTTSTPSPESRSRSSATRRAGEERQVGGEQGHDVRGRPREPGPQRRDGAATRRLLADERTSCGTGWGGPTTIRGSASATAASTVASMVRSPTRSCGLA